VPKPTRQRGANGLSGDWVVLVGTLDDSDALDLEYWLEHTTAAERVHAVHACLTDSLATKGKRVPRFRRVYRLVERAPGPLPDHRRLRGSVPRPPARRRD
jgi:hypothetical protein